MIETENTFGTTTIYCDGCSHEETFDGFDGQVDFMGAIKEAKEGGWIMKRVDGEWEHHCSEECRRKADG